MQIQVSAYMAPFGTHETDRELEQQYLFCPSCGEVYNIYPPNFHPEPGQGSDEWSCGECRATFPVNGRKPFGGSAS